MIQFKTLLYHRSVGWSVGRSVGQERERERDGQTQTEALKNRASFP